MPPYIENIEYIKILLLLSYSSVCAYMDLKTRRIRLDLSIIAAASGTAIALLTHEDLFKLSISIVPGILLCAVSIISNGAIGIGDAIFLTVCGFYLHADRIIVLIILSWLIAAVISLFITIKYRYMKCSQAFQLPFITIIFPVLLIVIWSSTYRGV